MKDSYSETEELRRKVVESEAEAAKLRGLIAEQDADLLSVGQRQSLLEASLTEAVKTNFEAVSRIIGLAGELQALREDHQNL